MTDWSELKEKVLLDCMKRLDVLGVQYAIIRTNGEKLGSLEVVHPKEKKRKKFKYPFKELRKHVGAVIEPMNVGDEGSIPILEYNERSVRSSATSLASKLWGNGTYISAISSDKKNLTILRVS